MAWSDEPTEMQLGTIYSWIRWHMTDDEAREAVAWLEKTTTRREVSYEMKRIRDLKNKRLLNAAKCFEGDVWEGFEHERA